jgi:hypothetical protein
VKRLLLILFPLFAPFSYALSQDDRLFFSSNWGYTGLLEIPDARVMEKEMWRPHVRQVNPYRFYAISFTPFEGLEITGRITEILGVKASPLDPRWKGYGNYKDKAVDLKFNFIKEGKYMPALSLGIMDPHGTRLYPSQYVVASKEIYPFDFTMGLGNGRLGKRPLPSKGEGFYVELFQDPGSWLKDAKFFYGVRFKATERLSFLVEYDPTEYSSQTGDPARKKYFEREPRTKYNFGLNYRPFKWLDLLLSFERGKTIGFGISTPFRIGEPLIPIADKVYKEPVEVKEARPEVRILLALSFFGFSDIGVNMEEKRIVIDLQNNRYFYTPKALHIILTNIAHLIPEHIDEVEIILKDQSVPLFSFSAKREDVLDFRNGKLTFEELMELSKIDFEHVRVPKGPKAFFSRLVLAYKPHFSLFLNDPSGFWKGKVGISGWLEYKLRDDTTFTFSLSLFPFTNISTVNEPLSIPVRTDIVDFLKRPLFLDRLLLNTIKRFPETDIFGRFTFGLLEIQYAGLDLELASPFRDGRFFCGISGSILKKRDPENFLFLKKDDVKDFYTPIFFNTRINIPEIDGAVDLKMGRFLAGDRGIRIQVSKFIKGVTVSAWVGLTDTSVFKDSINRGYRDKGISVTIPLRLFEGSDSRIVYGHSVSPWTRDVAQDIDHFTNLFDFIGRNTKKLLDRDRKRLVE